MEKTMNNAYATRCCLLLCLALTATKVNAQQIKVVDESGAVVQRYEMVWHTADSGYCRWQAGDNIAGELPREADVVDIVVRADGCATEVRRFEGETLAKLRADGATITLQRGDEVQLELNVPDGMAVPDDFLPQTYFPDFAWRVRMMWQPVNLRGDRVAPDFNMLGVSRVSDRVYRLRLAKEQAPFLVAFNHPGWLRFYEVGALSSRDVKQGVLEIDVPRPVTIQVTLDTGTADAAQLPFEDAVVQVAWANPETEGAVYSATWDERIQPNGTRTFSDLGPGQFSVTIRTIAKDGVEDAAVGTRINPGRFFARRKISVPAGGTHEERIRWMPFDPTANRGECRARLKLTRADGRPAAGATVKVQWYDGHYGLIDIHSGRTPDDGVVQLEGISSEVLTESPYGPYSVALDDKNVGWFRLQPTTDIQEFEFHMMPDVGDPAPEVDIIELESGKTHKLSDYRGQVVLLEFWATWCGPCQPAMKKLNQMAAEAPDWADRVAIIPLSVDQTPELAVKHVTQRGWTALRHFWSQPADTGQSEAQRDFIVHGIPTAVLLKPDGTIAWRGHPIAEYAGGVDLRSRIEALLSKQ
jgi:thiol-disulfide isomerase/thioredoxin